MQCRRIFTHAHRVARAAHASRHTAVQRRYNQPKPASAQSPPEPTTSPSSTPSSPASAAGSPPNPPAPAPASAATPAARGNAPPAATVAEAKAAEAPAPVGGSPPNSPAPAATPATSGNAPAQAQATASVAAAEAKAATADAPAIPDVHSMSLGLEDPGDDPKKWQKFVWKYLGTLVAFGIAYKSIGWYADRLDEEGKQKRDEVEERKAARTAYEEELALMKQRQQMALEQQKLLNQGPGLLAPTTAQAVDSWNAEYTPVSEKVGFVSELDQLRTLRAEVAKQMESADEAMLAELKAEQDELDKEIAELALQQ